MKNTYHTVDSLAGLGKYQLLYSPLTSPTCETVGVIRLITRHNSLLCNGLFTNETLLISFSLLHHIINGLPDTSNFRTLVIRQRGARDLYLPILGHCI